MKVLAFILLYIALLLPSCNEPTLRMEGFEVHGIDVSHYQSIINWDTVATQGIHFAFVKATEGKSLRDTTFCSNWDNMKRVGIKRGAYHFFRPTVSPILQAQNFTHLVELQLGDLPPVLDVEVLDGVSKDELIEGIKTWIRLVEVKYYVRPILYTNLKFYNRYLVGHFNDYPLWIARYNVREPQLACGTAWKFWQYGNQGRLRGINGNVDFNVFSGSSLELEELCLSAETVISQAIK